MAIPLQSGFLWQSHYKVQFHRIIFSPYLFLAYRIERKSKQAEPRSKGGVWENTNLFSNGWMTSPFVSWTMGISSSKSEQGDFQLALLKATKPKIVHRKQMIWKDERMKFEIGYYKKTPTKSIGFGIVQTWFWKKFRIQILGILTHWLKLHKGYKRGWMDKIKFWSKLLKKWKVNSKRVNSMVQLEK